MIIPEIAHYEVRQNSFLIRAVGSLRRLENWILTPVAGLTHLTLVDRRDHRGQGVPGFAPAPGIPTAAFDALDADAILAGQVALAASSGDTVTIATTNMVRTLNRFPGIDAQMWDQIR